MKKLVLLPTCSLAILAFSAISCNKENVPSSKSDIISVKVSGANPLSTRSDGVHTMVLEALEADAPSLYMVSSPYESDALSTKSAAITGSQINLAKWSHQTL